MPFYSTTDRGPSGPSLPSTGFSSRESALTNSRSVDIVTVTILKSEYDTLIQWSREYERLKQALIQGGIPLSSLETLIYSPDDLEKSPQRKEEASHSDPPPDTNLTRQAEPSVENPPPKHDLGSRPSPRQYPAHTTLRPAASTPLHETYDQDDVSVPSDEKMDSPYSRDGRTGPVKQQESVNDSRTVTLKNIPDRTTHAEVISLVRGGALVDVFVRSRERTASISFADPRAAQEFLVYAKRQHLCIFDKPIEAVWSDRQFTLSNYVASQVAGGATRNLLIRGVHLNLTEAQIREDMEHIHNLVIISVKFAQGNAYISTNSVQKASYARNCMRSRMPYKLMRIEYYPDECTDPLPKIQPFPKRDTPKPVKNLNPMANRFEMLLLEDETEDDSDGADNLTSCTPITRRVNWANNPIAV